jgi:hypothetical protein
MKKFALTFFVLLLLVVGVGVGVYLLRRQTDFREKAAPSSTLTLSPNKSTPSVDETFTVSANINTGSNQVVAVEIHATFDETKVEAIGASNSTFFVNPKNIGPSIDNNNGTLTYTVYTDPGSAPRQGQGTVAVLTFKAKSAGNTTIALSSDTLVGANSSSGTGDLGANVLTGSTPAVLTIQGSTQATSTPTPTGQSTSTPTPTSGSSSSTNTPTPTSSSNSGSSSTNTPTTRVGTATPATQLPDSGVSMPTVFGVGIGIFVLIGSALLAL